MNLNWILFVVGCGETESVKKEELLVGDTSCESHEWYLDFDGDGFGTPFETLDSCTEVEGYVDNSEDCNDEDSLEKPGQVWNLDADGDGYGNPEQSIVNCLRPIGYVLDASDCDDQDATRNASTFWYVDSDGDGFGDSSSPVDSCVADESASPNDQDCDDTNAFIRPNVNEICDEIDNNCDGLIDDADPNIDSFTQFPLYMDADGDGYGFEYIGLACATLNNESFEGNDCDDSNPEIHPYNLELTDVEDQNCDGESVYHFGNELRYGVQSASLTSSSKSLMYEDMTGDGVPDLVVHNTESNMTTGSVTILSEFTTLDQSSHLGVTLQWTDPVGGSDFGKQIVNVGDIDADGLLDWLVSAPGTDYEKVYLLNESSPSIDQGVWYWETPQGGNDFGDSMLPLGDIDGDGFIEVAVGAPKNNEGGTRTGAVFLLDEVTFQAGQTIPQISRLGINPYSQFGKDLDNVGDIDGDGIDEILILANTGSGIVYVFEPSQLFDSTFPIESTMSFVGPSHGAMNSSSVHRIGDFNGDGYKDFAVAGGSIGFLVNFGSPSLLQENSLGDAPLQLTHSNGNNLFARAVLNDVDLDGDGYDDLVFSNPGEDQSGDYVQNNHGIVQGFWGGNLTGVYDDTDAANFVIRGSGGGGSFLGYGLASGDVDQDGYTDIWIADSSTTVRLLFGSHMQ